MVSFATDSPKLSSCFLHTSITTSTHSISLMPRPIIDAEKCFYEANTASIHVCVDIYIYVT